MNLSGKTALITGASGGIGRALAQALAKSGANLALCGRDEERLSQTCALARDRGVEVVALPGDLTDPAYPAACVAQTVQSLGRLDVLINNAGIVLSKPFEDVQPDEYDRVMAVNARSPFLMCQAALPHLRASKGAIINIGSVVSHKGYPLQSAYAASKHALLGFTKALANEVFRDGVRVHVISPGGVFTDMVRAARPDLTPEGLILPEEIAEIALFLLSRRGNAVIDEIEVRRCGKAPFA